MKHTSRRILSGLLLIGLALLLVLQGLYSIFSGNIWVLIWMGLFVIFGLSRWFYRDWLSGLVFFYIAFLIGNQSYHWVHLSLSILILVGWLFFIGLAMIFPSSRRHWYKKRYDDTFIESTDDHHLSTSFGSSSRYINDPDFHYAKAEIGFGKLNVYFDNAIIQGDSAEVNVEVGFGKLVLYIPKNWIVKSNIETGFGGVDLPQTAPITEDSKTLYLKGEVGFGALSVVYL